MPAQKEKEFYEEEIAVLRPPEKLLISEWTEKYRILPPSAAEKGPIRLIRTPYLVPIMDCCLDHNVESVWFCKSAQIAGTEFVISVLGYYAHQRPSPCMMVLADEDTAKYMSKERIQRMFRDSTDLSQLILSGKMNVGEITLKNDSYIAMGWASSVAKLASRPMRLIIFDEIDKPGYSITSEEASPISLGIERTETFIDRLILGLSTPTKVTGNITKRLDECDVVYDWHVPCPECGQKQPLRWSPEQAYGFEKNENKETVYLAEDGEMHRLGGVVWEGSSAASEEQIKATRYACGECGFLWTTEQKNDAVLKGSMVARRPILRTPRRIGFHVNRLYSLLAKSGDLSKLVDEWLRCQGDNKELQGFINSTLAEPWKDFAGQERASEEILALKTDNMAGIVQESDLALILTADVQDNGIWYELRGWNDKYTSNLIKYGFLMKTDKYNGSMQGDFNALRDIVEAKYKTTDNREAIVRIAIVDSGYRTAEVYDFCMAVAQAHPSKGQEAKRVPIGYTKISTYPGTSRLIPGGVQLISFDSNYFKDKLATRLQVNVSDEGAWRLHIDTGNDYAEQYVSELKDKEKGVWVQISQRANHLWDTGVLQLIGLEILETQGMMQKLAKAEERRKSPPPPKKQQEPAKQPMW